MPFVFVHGLGQEASSWERTLSRLTLRGNRKAARQLAEEIRGAQLGWIEGAGHEANVEAPEALAECLKRFYEETGGVPHKNTNVL